MYDWFVTTSLKGGHFHSSKVGKFIAINTLPSDYPAVYKRWVGYHHLHRNEKKNPEAICSNSQQISG